MIQNTKNRTLPNATIDRIHEKEARKRTIMLPVVKTKKKKKIIKSLRKTNKIDGKERTNAQVK